MPGKPPKPTVCSLLIVYKTSPPDIVLDRIFIGHVRSVSEPPSSSGTIGFEVDLAVLEARVMQRIPSPVPVSQQVPGNTEDCFSGDEVTAIDFTVEKLSARGTLVRRPEETQQSLSLSGSLSKALAGLNIVEFPSRTRSRRENPILHSLMAVEVLGISIDFRKGNLQTSTTDVQVRLCHKLPGYAIAVVTAIVGIIKQISGSYTQLRSRATFGRRHIVRAILLHASSQHFVDPFSTIQPSYLVQSGLPHLLRTDAVLKILNHMRNTLQQLVVTDPNVFEPLHVVYQAPKEYRDDLSLLDAYLQRFFPDVDAAQIARQLLLSVLFGAIPSSKAQSHKILGGGFELLKLASITLLTVRFSLAGPSGDSDCSIDVGPVVASIQHQLSRFIPASASKSESPLAPAGSYSGESHMDFLVISGSLGNTVFTIVPHVLDFIPHLLRSFRRLSPPSPQSSHRAQSRRAFAIDSTLSAQSLRVQAAAANLICEVGLGGLVFAGRMTSHSPGRTQDLHRSSSLSVIFSHLFLRARSIDGQAKQEHNILASLEFRNGRGSIVLQDIPRSFDIRRLIMGCEGIELRIPRSAIRLYRFVEEWRAVYLPPLQGMMDNILSEFRKPAPQQIAQEANTQRRISLHLQLAVMSIRVSLQVMLGTWLSWEAIDTTAYLHSSLNPRRSSLRFFGLQARSQVISVASLEDLPRHHDTTTRVKLVIPELSIAGRYDEEGLYALTAVEFFQVTVKPSHWDTVLSVQQKFGNDFQDLVTLIAETRRKRGLSSASPRHIHGQRQLGLRYAGFLKMRGFRIGLEGLTSTIYLECEDIAGGTNNAEGRILQVYLTNLALSLSPGPRIRNRDLGFNRTHKSAFVDLDVQMDLIGGLTRMNSQLLQITIPKIHAVMRPSSIGEFADFIDQLQVRSPLCSLTHIRAQLCYIGRNSPSEGTTSSPAHRIQGENTTCHADIRYQTRTATRSKIMD
jgi:hypothetical protein